MSITEIVVTVLIGSFVGVFIGLVIHEHMLWCRKTRAETKLYDALRTFINEKGRTLIYGKEE